MMDEATFEMLGRSTECRGDRPWGLAGPSVDRGCDSIHAAEGVAVVTLCDAHHL
jgi:hypothetical protein